MYLKPNVNIDLIIEDHVMFGRFPFSKLPYPV